MRETVVTIAGSDSSGGAGIQADLKTVSANGGYAATVVTAITAQNTRGIVAVEALPARLVRAQMDAVFADFEVGAVKIGMLAGEEIVRAVAEGLRAYGPRHVVCDPVMVSKSGTPLLPDECVETLRREVLPLATLLTPNAHEAGALTGIEVRNARHAEEAGRRLLTMGAKAVLVKGGHLEDSPGTDLLVTPEGCRRFRGDWVSSPHTHGTGCTYSAAIATQLARGLLLAEAIAVAKEFVTQAIRFGLDVGNGTGPVDPFFFLRTAAGGGRFLARLLETPGGPQRTSSRIPGVLQIITDETIQERFSHEDLARLAAQGGADTVQFREKRPRTTAELITVARRVAEAVRGRGARVVVNDRVDVAVAAGVPAVHLGRSDLDPEVARRLLGPDAVIGGTANSLEEARRVAGRGVDYLGVGPVFGTRTKSDPAPALGLAGLEEIAHAVEKPVLAIGSITPEHVADVLGAGARGIAVVRAVVCEADPAAATRRFRDAIDACGGRIEA